MTRKVDAVGLCGSLTTGGVVMMLNSDTPTG